MCFFKIHVEAKNVIQPIDCADLLTLIKATQILSELFSLGALPASNLATPLVKYDCEYQPSSLRFYSVITLWCRSAASDFWLSINPADSLSALRQMQLVNR